MAMTIQQLQDFSNTFPELRWLTEEIIDYLEANPGGGGVQSATVTLTDAQIKNLMNTPVQVVAAPGANKIIIGVQTFFNLNTSAGGYDEAIDVPDGMHLVYDGDNNALVYLTLDGGTFQTAFDRIWTGGVFSISSELKTIGNNKALMISLPGATPDPFTGGNAANTLKVTVYYVVVDL